MTSSNVPGTGFPQTDGLFCENDYIAAGAITALQEMGLLGVRLLKHMIVTGGIPRDRYQLQSRLIPRKRTSLVQ
ncbi:MAG: hypothetical protein VB025_04835 [Sphaerochaeta sp.]|nr:hypothetical protein [Sphaerochaeta sp.]PKL25309.1 MAG: hypothetical protein CVV46_16320 [Spirochaetae bacterium HGW-Spirochaetae-2]